jgi:plasmid stabilization system protein ParE
VLEPHFTRRATREVDRAAKWWSENRPSALGAVKSDLVAAVALLCAHPALGIKVLQASSRGVRRFYLERIRYWIYYRVRDERLEIVSVWHASRGRPPAV